MKNYLLLIVDSLNYSHVQKSKLALMPYMESLKKQSVYCSSMYAQAPYTEAAVMNLYCGQNVLDNGGYLKRFELAPKTLFEAMRENGYKTYYNSYQPQCYPSSLRRGVDDIFYSVGYDLSALWPYRLEHYSALYKRGELTKQDYDNLYDILDDNFNEWIAFADNLIKCDLSCSMISDNAQGYNPNAVRDDVIREKELYHNDKKQYLESLLIQGRAHSLFAIPAFEQRNKISDRAFIKQAQELYNPLIKTIAKKNFKLNLKNNKRKNVGFGKQLKRFIVSPSKRTLKDFLKCGYANANVLFDFDLKQRIDENYDYFKNAPSARTHFDHYLNWAEKNTEPYFACIHVDDVHNPEIFFTYDSMNLALLQKEKEISEELVAQIGADYYGSITHDLSLRYIDNCIEYLFESMKEKGIYDDTCVIITADHGFSFSNNPSRESFVTNLYLENYNVPCIIVNSGNAPREITDLRTTKDIPATICELAFGNSVDGFSGKSVISSPGYKNVMIEYCGGGCPDLKRRELKIAAFDDDWFVGSLCALDAEASVDKITEVYNLKEDPQQFNNLANQLNDCPIQYLIDIIFMRISDLKHQLTELKSAPSDSV